ncbi:MAG: HAD-IIA family hydrolase [Microbacteriaceae bacterium]|nr:HAD-IIA family hydrolase [Microbacteriaceae bacterium]
MTVSGALRAPEKMYEAYLFDLDGTVYLGDSLLPGAHRLLTHLKDEGIRTIFLSNNPTKDRQQYVAKLTGLGLEVDEKDVVNTIVSMVAWLTRTHPGATVFPIAEEPLIRALLAAGIRISDDPAEIDIVIASYDRTFDYRKLQIAFDAIWFHKRAILVTTNPDRYCPFPGGAGEPDAAAIVAAIEASTGTTCLVNVGKPDAIMIETVTEALDVDVRNCLMVGDRLSTDVKMALNAGMASALVLTGDTTVADLQAAPAEDQPTYVLDRLDQLVPGFAELSSQGQLV